MAPLRLLTHTLFAPRGRSKAGARASCKPLVDRATQFAMLPGSTFKVVTATAAIDPVVFTRIDGQRSNNVALRRPLQNVKTRLRPDHAELKGSRIGSTRVGAGRGNLASARWPLHDRSASAASRS